MGTLKCPHNYGVVIVSHSYGDVPVPITLRLLTQHVKCIAQSMEEA